MNKVIIITRKGEYNSQEIFSRAISSIPFLTSQIPLINIFTAHHLAMRKWENAKNEYGNEQVAAAKLRLDFNPFVEALINNEDSDIPMISQLEKRLSENMSYPYAQFCTSEYEVILILTDNLQIEHAESIPNINGFMDCVKKDCEIEGNDNILYIHDTQIDGVSKNDETIFRRENNEVIVDLISNKPDYSSLAGLKDNYKYIAAFKHLPNKSSYFQSQILAMRFGKPDLLDELIKIEKEIDERTTIDKFQNHINNAVERWEKNIIKN